MSWRPRERQQQRPYSTYPNLNQASTFQHYPNHQIIDQKQEQLRCTTKATKFAYHYDNETEIAGQCQEAVDMFYANPIFEDPALITTVQKKMVRNEIWKQQQLREIEFDHDGLPSTPSASEDESEPITYHRQSPPPPPPQFEHNAIDAITYRRQSPPPPPTQLEDNVINFGATIYENSSRDIMNATQNHQLLDQFGDNTLRNDEIAHDEDNMYFNHKMYIKQMMIAPAKNKQYCLSDFAVKKNKKKKKKKEDGNKKRRRRGGRGGKNRNNKDYNEWQKQMFVDRQKAKELVAYIERAKSKSKIYQ